MGGVIKATSGNTVFTPGASTVLAALSAAAAAASAASVPALSTIQKLVGRNAAGKWGQGTYLQRSTWLKSQAINFTTGAYSASANFLTVPGLPCNGTQGVATTQEEFVTTKTQLFKDKDGTPVCSNLALFTATFVSGSPNFTVTAWRQGNPGLLPPGAPSPLSLFGTSDPLMPGMPLWDQTNSASPSSPSNVVIPANACVGSVPATPYASGGGNTYTMVDPAGNPVNAVSSATINVQTGGQMPGVPIIPPASFNINTVDFQLTYAGSFGITQNPDDLDFAPFNFADVTKLRKVGGSTNTRVHRSAHYVGYGPGDLEQRLPLLGRKGGALGNSALAHEPWTKVVALETRSEIVYRGALGGRQVHQFLDGIAATANTNAPADSTNWNGQNPTNLNGAAVAADFNGLDYLFIGTCGPNEQGYSNGAGGLGNDLGGAAGGGQMPYTIGSITENGAACVANVTTAANSASITINSFVSKSALNPTLIGLKFPTTAPNGLAGKTIIGQTSGSTGGTGGYTLDSGTGVSAGTTNMVIGSYLGTMNWMLTTLRAYNATNGGRMQPIIVDPCPRFDLGSSNGGRTSGTWDAVNPGNPICASTGLRLSDFYNGNTQICSLWGLERVDLFTKAGLNTFTADALFNSDLLHLNDQMPAPLGDRVLGQMAASRLNAMFPIL